MTPSLVQRRSIVAVLQLPPPVNGLSTVNSRMIAAMEEASFDVLLADVSPGPLARGLAKWLSRGRKVMRAAGTMVRARMKGAQTLYMPCDGGAGIASNIFVALLARTLGFRLWLHHHSFAYVDRHSVLMKWLLCAAPVGTVHIALCEGMLSQLREQYLSTWIRKANTGEVLPNSFMIDVPIVEGCSSSARLRIGHLSNLTIEKGALAFLEIFERLLRAGVDVEARLAGGANEEIVRDAIRKAMEDHPDRFEWVGPIFGPEKARFYANIDAFIFPSRYPNEAQPLVLLEALSAGAVVVSTDRGCVRCDHAESPGLISSEAGFEATAADWLAVHLATAEQRSAARVAARDRSVALNRNGRVALAGIVQALGAS